LQRLQKRDPAINAEFLDGMNGKKLLDVPQNLFMKKLIELGIAEMKACKIYEWFWGLFIDFRASKKKNLMKVKEITKYKTDEEIAEDERKEKERIQKQKDKDLAELNKVQPLLKPIMVTCSTCNKSINANGLEKHMLLCNYTSKNLKKRKIEKLGEITNKIDSDEKQRLNRISMSNEKLGEDI